MICTTNNQRSQKLPMLYFQYVFTFFFFFFFLLLINNRMEKAGRKTALLKHAKMALLFQNLWNVPIQTFLCQCVKMVSPPLRSMMRLDVAINMNVNVSLIIFFLSLLFFCYHCMFGKYCNFIRKCIMYQLKCK